MKDLIEQHLAEALAALQANGCVPSTISPSIVVTRTRVSSHGDFASNLALMLAKPARRAPHDIAQALIEALPQSDLIREVVIAGPGFINFFLAGDAQSAVIATVLVQGEDFGRSQFGEGQRVQVVFVSANPGGPVPAGHGRGVALAATIGNMMDAIGFDVQHAYHVSDAGRQMHVQATRVWLRYLALVGETVDYPRNDVDGDVEEPMDALILRAQGLLGAEDYQLVVDRASNAIIDAIKRDLGELDIHYDLCFSERGAAGDVQRVVEKLDAAGHVYEQDGVRWFRSTRFGDDKDCALVRTDGLSTNLAFDIACLDNQLARGVDKVLSVSIADDHGHTARMAAACQALGHPRQSFECLQAQSAILYRGGERVPMSTPSGSLLTIRKLHEEVGKDAVRFFHVMRKYSQPLDIDLDLAVSQTRYNPVYQVQYAYALICSVMRQLGQRGLAFDRDAGLHALPRLADPAEAELMRLLSFYPELIHRAALAHEPHQLTGYLRDLANGLHSYYNAHKVLVYDDELRHARVCLLLAIRQVLGNGLSLIGVSTAEVM